MKLCEAWFLASMAFALNLSAIFSMRVLAFPNDQPGLIEVLNFVFVISVIRKGG
jgi:hypothetical protein